MNEKPLDGLKILVTRAEEDAAALATRLQQLGAEAFICPTIMIRPPENFSTLDHALKRLIQGDYTWVIFTSVNGVRFTLERARALGIAPEAFASARLAAIGPATGCALAKEALAVDHMPHEYLAEAIVDGLGVLSGKRILLPRAQIAGPALAERLKAAGALVDEVTAYLTLPTPKRLNARLKRLLARQELDWATFTSASTVRHFVGLMQRENLEPKATLRRSRVACIGPVTAREAEAVGLRVDIMAQEHTIDGLIAALVGVPRGEGLAAR
jgi:uroporphyrinogen III methyltransferase/synthase